MERLLFFRFIAFVMAPCTFFAISADVDIFSDSIDRFDAVLEFRSRIMSGLARDLVYYRAATYESYTHEQKAYVTDEELQKNAQAAAEFKVTALAVAKEYAEKWVAFHDNNFPIQFGCSICGDISESEGALVLLDELSYADRIFRMAHDLVDESK